MTFRTLLRGTAALAVCIALAVSAALVATSPAQAVIVRDDVGLPASVDTADEYPSAVQLFFFDNLFGDLFFDCSGTLINPRTVITAAHCVNFQSSETYDVTNPFLWSILVGTGVDTSDRVFNFLDFGSTYSQGGLAGSVDVIVHPAADPDTFALPFPFGDVALIALDEPITDIPSMGVLLSPMSAPFHAAIAAYGSYGTGTTGDVAIGLLRRRGENTVDMLGSFNDLFTAVQGSNPEYESQNLYWIDMDDPNRPDAPAPCGAPGSGVEGFPSCPSVAAFHDLNWFGGDALPNEAGTAGGDSGSAIIVDQAFDIPLVAGVLSGGWNWDFFYPGLGVPGGYGDQSYYNPLYLYFEFITQNTPYKYVSAKAGGGAWENPATWTQELDPGFFIIDGDGNLVNGIPTGTEPGVGGTTPKWGDVFGIDTSGFDTTPNPGLPFTGLPDDAMSSDPAHLQQVTDSEGNPVHATEGVPLGATEPRALADLIDPTSPLLGPGSTNFVPHNTFGSPGTAFENPALFFEVWLNRPGTVTLSSLKDVDRLEISDPDARLWIQDSGDLLTVIETAVIGGELTVDGILYAPLVGNIGGEINGHGTIVTNALENLGVVAPGNSVESLLVVGDYVQGLPGILEIELGASINDELLVVGDAYLDGLLHVLPNGGDTPVAGNTYRIIETDGSVVPGFAALDDDLPGLLYVSSIIYGPDFVDLLIDATPFCVFASGPIQTPACEALDELATTGSPEMLEGISGLQGIDTALLPAALESLNPTRVHAQGILGQGWADIIRNQLGHRSHDLLGSFGGPGNEAAALIGTPGAQIASADPSAEMLASAAITAIAASGGPSAIELPNGYGLFMAGDVAFVTTDQPGGLGEDDGNAEAVTAGLDYNNGNGFVGGLAFSYLAGRIAQDYGLGGSTEGSGGAISGFANYRGAKMYVDLYASYGVLGFDTHRTILVGGPMLLDVAGAPDATQAQAGATLGVDLFSHGQLKVGGVGGLYYHGLDIDGYTESGGGVFSAIIPDRSIDSLKGSLGGEATFNFLDGGAVPFVRLLLNHEFEDNAFLTSAAFAGGPSVPFNVPGPELGETWASVGVGLSGNLSASTTVYVRYEGEFGRDGQSQSTVSAAARVGF